MKRGPYTYPEYRRARDAEMSQLRTEGHTLAQIAQLFGIHTTTVHERIRRYRTGIPRGRGR